MSYRTLALAVPALALVLALGACASAPEKPRGIFDLSNGPGTSASSPTASGLSDIPRHGGNSGNGFSSGGTPGGYSGGTSGNGSLSGGTSGGGMLGSGGGSPGY